MDLGRVGDAGQRRKGNRQWICDVSWEYAGIMEATEITTS